MRYDLLVYYINLDRRIDRRNAILQNLSEQGVPDTCIVRFPGIDRDAFECPEDFVEYATARGFPELQKMVFHDRGKKYMGYALSYLMALRDISHGDRNALLILDDYLLMESYEKIKESLNDLPQPFYLAMLTHKPNEITPIKTFSVDLPPNSKWEHGGRAGDGANIFTPIGARFILKILLTMLPIIPENQFGENLIFQNTMGFYHRKDEDMAVKNLRSDSDIRNERWKTGGWELTK